MRKIMMAAVGVATLGAFSSANAGITECKDIDCSGRHIECGRKLPWDKVRCEAEKAKWKAGCEAKKGACQIPEKALN